MASRQPIVGPALRRAINAAAAAAGVADAAQQTADGAVIDAADAQGTADVALEVATLAFEGAVIVNGTLSASASAGAVTINILTAAGNTPTALDAAPVQVTFRDQTTAEYTILVTSAKTLVIPSGADIGVANTSVPVRLWVMGVLDNAKTDFELGVVNAVGDFVGQIRQFMIPDRYLYGNQLGVGAIGASSDSSGNIYTTSIASAGRAVRILGQVLWESGLGTIGTWTTPSNVVLQGRGVPGPGAQLGYGEITKYTKSTFTVATVCPFDNTTPLYAERVFWNTIGFVPESGANLIEVEAQAYLSPPAAATVADYVGIACGISNADANIVGYAQVIQANKPQLVRLQGTIRPPIGGLNQNNLEFGILSSIVGNVVMNGVAANQLFNSTSASFIRIREIVA